MPRGVERGVPRGDAWDFGVPARGVPARDQVVECVSACVV